MGGFRINFDRCILGRFGGGAPRPHEGELAGGGEGEESRRGEPGGGGLAFQLGLFRADFHLGPGRPLAKNWIHHMLHTREYTQIHNIDLSVWA